MRRYLLVALRMALLTLLLTGVVYPLVMTGILRVVFPHRTAGSLIERDGRVVGSSLIGQTFASDSYFHGRPSAAGPNGYDASASGASNLGPTSRRLAAEVASRVTDVTLTEGVNAGQVPVDLVTASASGLDPDISPASALLQVPRVAHTRDLPESTVRDLVLSHVRGRTFGLLGEPRVNVLELNLALDEVSLK